MEQLTLLKICCYARMQFLLGYCCNMGSILPNCWGGGLVKMDINRFLVIWVSIVASGFVFPFYCQTLHLGYSIM